MKITPDVFEAFSKCPTKAWLRAAGELPTGNTYAEWVKAQTASYRATETQRLLAGSPQDEIAISPAAGDLKTAKWRLASSVTVQAQMESCSLESELHAVERVPSEGRGRPAQFIPIRFVFTNKLGKDDKLLLAFDAFLLAAVLGREIAVGKIIHGDRGCARESAANSGAGAEGRDAGPTSAALSRAQPQATKVKTAALAGEVRKRIEKLATPLSGQSPPDLVLNRHCAECEFQARCRKIAIEKDDLSLLRGMSAKERQQLRSKGIFTVTQLSYTFRPRRRPKRMRDKREKYHHSLKALAIREKKIHIVGSPELKIEGTPVYLDVEGLPDRDFYYLIGLRIGNGESAVQHSLWADTVADEGKIWREFIAILETVEKPVLIHYGSYETVFIHKMGRRYDAPMREMSEKKWSQASIDVLTMLAGQVYFPTYSNSLKDVASWLGFAWQIASPAGVNSIRVRHEWERSRDPSAKDQLVAYNRDDCRAMEVVSATMATLWSRDSGNGSQGKSSDAVHVESLKNNERKIGPFVSPFKEFEEVALAAWWDYQRDRIYVKAPRPVRKALASTKRERLGSHNYHSFNKSVVCSDVSACPFCGGQCLKRARCTRAMHDLYFGHFSMKRWIVQFRFRYYWCPRCKKRLGEPHDIWPQSHFGRNLVAYVLYETIELFVPFVTVQENLSRFFKLDLPVHTLLHIKKSAGKQYTGVFEDILRHLVRGDLLHIDETHVSIRGKTAFVWVFTNLHEVAYLYTPSREGSFLEEMLKDFTGVLVSDFYTAYDSLKCTQQKCLVHLMRDLNDDVLAHPYDEELKALVKEFAALLKEIVDTIHHRGLKRRFLRKHLTSVKRFYRTLTIRDCQSEQATKCKQRFEKNRDKLFTFLNFDGIPWNNNNAEHAVRAFGKLRDIVRGSFTEASVRNYLTLLSISQTCKYSGVDFFGFLRSGVMEFHAFAESRRRRRHQPATSQPEMRPADETSDK